MTCFYILLQVNDKIDSINGQLISTLPNKEIMKCLIKPNAVIIIIPSDTDRRNKLCLKANGICVKKNHFKKLCVIESINPNIIVGSVIVYVNGVHSNNVNNDQISIALLYPNCNIVYENDVIHQCLQANSIYASRKIKYNKVVVTHSNRSDISIGTVLINIDSYYVHELCNERIIKLLLEPNRTFQFDMDIIQKCLQANSIYALRNGNSNEVIVTHSSRSNIPIGTVLLKIDSHDVHELNNESIYKLLLQPNRIL